MRILVTGASVGEDHVVAFDFTTGRFAGPVVHLARLNGQALALVP